MNTDRMTALTLRIGQLREQRDEARRERDEARRERDEARARIEELERFTTWPTGVDREMPSRVRKVGYVMPMTTEQIKAMRRDEVDLPYLTMDDLPDGA